MMHSRKKISLVLCTYNGEEYIEELLNSIVYQTYKPDEIIVYDDYSTDNTVEILSKFMIKHSNLNWFLYRQNENVGWKKNFHDALKKATGDIIFLCDQDDIWFEHKIEKMTTAIEKNDRIKLLACSYKIRYEEDSKTKNQKLKNDNKIYRVKRSKDFIYPKRPGCTYAIKKEILLEFFKVWDSTSPHDAVLWKIAYLTQTLYLYNYNGIVFRRHLTNASSYHNSRYSIERFNQKYESLLSIKKSLMNLAELNIDNKARRKLYKFTKFNNIRLSAYTTKSIFNILKVVFMKKYFDSMKTYLLDIFLILKYSNKTSKSKGD